MRIERTFTVPVPPERVFAYLADFTRTEQWDPGTVRTVRTGGDGGLGTTYANTSRFLGRTVHLTYETVVHEPASRVVFRGRNGGATATDDLTVGPAPGGHGSRVHYRATFDFGRLGNAVFPLLVRRRVEALADETIGQLCRALVEHA